MGEKLIAHATVVQVEGRHYRVEVKIRRERRKSSGGIRCGRPGGTIECPGVGMILFKEGAIMLRTEICDLLGIELPIIQGGMAWIATAELAAAVSEAGGLGMIAAGNAPAEVVREEILKARQLTNKPFGVNVMLMSEHVDAVMKEILELRVSVITTGAGNPGNTYRT